MAVHGLSVKLGLDRNRFVGSALVLFYNAFSRAKDARNAFDETPDRDYVLWTSMVSGYAQNGEAELALRVFREMVSDGIEGDIVAAVSLLLACGQLGSLRHGRSVHGFCVRRRFGLPLSLGNAIVDMYVKCGVFGYAERVFGRMPVRDVISWSALILGHGMNGRADDAFELFQRMQREAVVPNSVTFLGVLSACVHSGMVEKAWEFFHMMKKYKVEPELKHYACIVDALGRSGQIVEAEEFLGKMPMEPDEAILGALLSGCRVHGNVDVGGRVARKLMAMRPDKSGYYTILANMYSDVGRYEEADKVRGLMKSMNVGKLPGCSLIELDEFSSPTHLA